MSELRLNCWRCWPTCQSGTWKSSSASIWTNIKTFTLYPKNTQVLGRFKLCINTYRIDGREMAETEVVPIDMPDSNGHSHQPITHGRLRAIQPKIRMVQ
ncbi:hypothetical protein CI641_023750 [Escherichia coli]|nr:hypothetical protein CI641_023750 [Escherichia coli]